MKNNKIQDLEKQVEAIQNPTTKVSKNKKKELEDQIYELKRQYKSTVMVLEENNYDKLFFFDSDKGFKKLAFNSALYYNSDIATRINRRAKLDIDRDHYSHSDTGTVSFKIADFDDGLAATQILLDRLAAIQIVRAKEQPYEGITIFELPKKYTKAVVEELKDRIQKVSQQINEIVMPKSPYPTLFSDIRDLNTVIYQNVYNAQPLVRNTIGRDLFGDSNKMMNLYCFLANNRMDVGEGLSEIALAARRIMYEMKNVENLRIMHNKAILAILELATKINAEANKEYKKCKATPERLVEQNVRG